jgi:hypothetical protein
MRIVLCRYLFLALACVIASTQDKPIAEFDRRDPPKGQLIPSVRSVTKPEQSYALYLPSNYTPARNSAIIYVFDPGAKGSRPLELMKDAAERHGYMLAGSNNSRNGSWEVEREAAMEMWNDTHSWLAIDDKRVYFAGMSGGARLAAQLAQSCHCAQGAFLNAAGFNQGSPPSSKSMFAVFVTAGMTDFNYGELVDLDAQLQALGFRHFFQRFPGRHGWAPKEIWEQALAWTTLLEIKDGLRQRDSNMISAELARSTERLRKREGAGELYFALGEYRSTVAAFDGLADTAALKQRISALENNRAVRDGEKREKAEIDKQHALEDEIFRATGAIPGGGGDLNALRAEATNKVHALREDVRNEKRPEARRALERVLGSVFVGSMETGSQFMDRGDYHTAEAYFSVAAEAVTGWAWPYLSLARCHAMQGKKKDALRDLKLARENGATAAELAEFVKGDPKLASLVDTAEYQKLVSTPEEQGVKK